MLPQVESSYGLTLGRPPLQEKLSPHVNKCLYAPLMVQSRREVEQWGLLSLVPVQSAGWEWSTVGRKDSLI